MRRGGDSGWVKKTAFPLRPEQVLSGGNHSVVSSRSDFPGPTYKFGPLCSAIVWPGVTGHTARMKDESSEQRDVLFLSYN